MHFDAQITVFIGAADKGRSIQCKTLWIIIIIIIGRNQIHITYVKHDFRFAKFERNVTLNMQITHNFYITLT